ncbi:hypothetical protein QBC32DRAFT_223613, partial [Pseudoneurospora amorphoporcata]
SWVVRMKGWASPFTHGRRVASMLPAPSGSPVAWGNGRAGSRNSWQPGCLPTSVFRGFCPRPHKNLACIFPFASTTSTSTSNTPESGLANLSNTHWTNTSQGTLRPYEAAMPQPASMKKYLPDDAPWSKYHVKVLEGQCLKRGLYSIGTQKELVQRLEHYRETHPGQQRRNPWIPHFSPNYAALRARTRDETFRVARIQNLGDGTISFLLNKDGGPDDISVVFKTRPVCVCEDYLTVCVHIIYMLRYILNVPEPLRWQRSFLSSEWDEIYKRSHIIKSVAWPEQYRHALGICLICFRRGANDTRCGGCSAPLHNECVRIVNKMRRIDSDVCTVCLDKQRGERWTVATGCKEKVMVEAERALAAKKAKHAVTGEEADPEEDGDSSSEEDSSDEDPGEEAPGAEEQPSNAPGQAISQRDSLFSALIKQERHSPPAGQQIPSSSLRPQQQQPASSPIRRQQPSRAAKDIGLARQSLAAAAEAPSRSPRRSQGRTPARTLARSQTASARAQTITPVPVPVIPAHALFQIQQQQQQQIRQVLNSFEARRPQSAVRNALRAPPFSAPRAPPFAVAPLQDPVVQASATPEPNPAPPVEEPVAAAPVSIPEPGSAVPAAFPAHAPTTVSASAIPNKEKRKATKLARKLKSLARKSAYVREHADRELKRLAKKSKRLEKKAKALAKRNEASGDE